MILPPVFTVVLLLPVALANSHHFCWCISDQEKQSDKCLTQIACQKYPRNKFYGVYNGDKDAGVMAKMSFKKQKCFGTRTWPIIPHPFLGGNEFEEACYAAVIDLEMLEACEMSKLGRTGIKAICSKPSLN